MNQGAQEGMDVTYSIYKCAPRNIVEDQALRGAIPNKKGRVSLQPCLPRTSHEKLFDSSYRVACLNLGQLVAMGECSCDR
jgi:hypothetical protein